jgi:hypothetical protein
MEDEDDWEMQEPKDGFTKEDERYLFRMLKNMPIPREERSKGREKK